VKRQTPEVLIIGSGRVATHWSKYLSDLGVAHVLWARNSEDCDTLVTKSKRTKNIFIAVADDAINEIYQHIKPHLDKDTNVFHFSGSKTIEGVSSIHPLFSFPPDPMTLEQYQGIPLISSDLNIPTYLKNPKFVLDEKERELYYSLCVFAGNIPDLIITQALKSWREDLGLPDSLLRNYIQLTLKKTLVNPEFASLTGPLKRNDQETISKVQSTLKNHLKVDFIEPSKIITESLRPKDTI
jgi:predicted short-subunit dehydrogenase-like oxidoreductase (DUF2520 family)